MDTRRILFVSPTAKIAGGGEVVLTKLVKHLHPSDWERAVAVPHDGEYVQIWRRLGAHCFRLPLEPLTGRSDIRSLQLRFHLHLLYVFCRCNLEILRVIGSFRPHYVYINSFWAAFYVAVTSKLCQRRVVWHVHDLIRVRLFNRLAISVVQRFVDSVVVISGPVGRNMVANGVPRSKIVVIHNGIDVERFDPGQATSRAVPPEMEGVSDEDFVIVSVGRLIRRKGHITLINAIALIAEDYPNVRLIILGEPYGHSGERYRDELVELTKDLGLQDRVLFVGWQSNVEEFMWNCDVVVSTSWAEPFGLGIVEGMAAGCPVIATNGGGESEIVIDGVTGLLVAPRDQQSLAAAIVRLVENESLCRKMGAAGLQRARRCFSVSRFVSDVAEALEP